MRPLVDWQLLEPVPTKWSGRLENRRDLERCGAGKELSVELIPDWNQQFALRSDFDDSFSCGSIRNQASMIQRGECLCLWQK